MSDRIPFIVYGDGPRLPSGLARIARDLLIRLLPEEERLGIAVHQLGVDPPDGWHWQAWPFWGLQPSMGDQGRAALDTLLTEVREVYAREPVVLMIMDPSRCYDLTRWAEDPRLADQGAYLAAQIWGYFPIDSENVWGGLSGPAAEAVKRCDRVLAYGRYGAEVLHTTLEGVRQPGVQTAPLPRQAVPYLPHGLDSTFRPGLPLEAAGEGFADWRRVLPPDASIIGCVATNQLRKDLSLLFASAAILKRQGPVGVWLHTDQLTNAWDIGQLCGDFNFRRREICVSTAEHLISDAVLAARYGASDATLGVGLGEGFGYPLVESLACGTPTIHVRFAGGAELIPRLDWLVEPAGWRLESCYAVKRPVLKPEDVAETLARAIRWRRQDPDFCRAYCSGAVSYLGWDVLWPRWRSWIARGLKALREERTDGTRRTIESLDEDATGAGGRDAEDTGV